MNALERLTQDKSKHGLHTFKLYFEDIKEDRKAMRKVTRTDRAWYRAYRTGDSLISAARHLFRTDRSASQ